MYTEGNIETCSPKIFYRGKEMSYELVWMFLALIILHAKRMRRILLSSVTYRYSR
jgi:hypothetical protein